MTPPIPSETNVLLIEMPSWVGDCVMATPVLRAARVHCPGARIVGIMRPGLEKLLAGVDGLDELRTVNPRGMRGVIRTAAAIRVARPDAGLLLPNSFRSALALRLSGTPRRVGYARDGRSLLLTDRLEVNKQERPLSTLTYYMRLAFFAFDAKIDDTRPKLAVTDADRVAADALLHDVDAPFIVVNPGGNKEAKRWPAQRFGDVARALASSHDVRVVVNGAPSERAIVETVVHACPPGTINLIERGVTLASLKGVLARASLLLTNDTGPRHIAAALGTPTVALFGPTDHRWTTLPVTTERILISEPFLTEELIADDHPTSCRIERIPVSDVRNAANELLEELHD